MKLLKDKVLKLIELNPESSFISVHQLEGISFDPTKFSNIEDYLPLMQLDEDGVLKSNEVVVLTQRPTAYGPTLGACLGFAYIDNEDELMWASDDGETVVGWMPMPNTENLSQEIDYRKITYIY